MAEKVEALRKWAGSRARMATSPVGENGAGNDRKLIDLAGRE